MEATPFGTDASWMVPVPVRKSSFVSLRSQHAHLNVEVDLARIGAFELGGAAIDPEELLLADLQTNPDANVRGRLGSGRSGFYRGHYLKGIGRTLLAGHWNDIEDRYHGSGHLLPSAAVRELLVSRLLEARGLSSCVNGCDGLLLRPLAADGRAKLRTLLSDEPTPASLCELDLRFQAISVKRGGFARLSNFLWSFYHLEPTVQQLSGLLLHVFRFLDPETHARAGLGDCTPAGLATAFARALERAFETFGAAIEAGVYWGSFHNNFTADGRFLDLEVPTIFGSPFVGIAVKPEDALEPEGLFRPDWMIGFEVFHLIRQMRQFLRTLLARLRLLAELLPRDASVVRRFVRQWIDAMKHTFGPEHALFCRDAAVDRAVRLLAERATISAAYRPALTALAEAQYERIVEGKTAARTKKLAMRRLEFRPARAEPVEPFRFYYPVALEGAFTLRYDAGGVIAEEVARIEAMTSLDEALAAIGGAEQRILRDCGSVRLPEASCAER